MPENVTDAPSSLTENNAFFECKLRTLHCVARDVSNMLRDSGLRPTRQRVALGRLLYASGDRHVTAEMLHEEANSASIPVSLATVYNTLHQLTEAGLLRELAVEGSKMWFDTNTTEHHHFLLEDDNQLLDIPGAGVTIDRINDIPEGMEIARIEVIVRLRRTKAS
jgi:Fur family transcriptional regulator, iron response regulator